MQKVLELYWYSDNMAINVVNSVATFTGFVDDSFTVSFDASGADALVFTLFVATDYSIGSVTSTYNSSALTRRVVQQMEDENGEMSSSIWTIPSPTTGSNNLVVSWDGETTQAFYYAIHAISGVNASDLVEGTDTVVGSISPGTATSIYASGQEYSVTQAGTIPSIAFVTGMIGLGVAGSWSDSGSGTPVLTGGVDYLNVDSGQTNEVGASMFGGYIISSGTGAKAYSIYSTATQVDDSIGNDGDSGGVMLLINGLQGAPQQILSS